MSESRREHSPVPPARDRSGGTERSGPLIVERHRKADGRLLILYRAAGGDPAESIGATAGEDV